jgi:hypothetical protein
MSEFNFKTYKEFRENNGWDACIDYLDELQRQKIKLPHDTEINMLIGMYYQSYSLLDPEGDMNPDNNATVLAIRQFVIEQIDVLLTVETLIHINISMGRPLNSDDTFLIENLLSKELGADVTIALVEESVGG